MGGRNMKGYIMALFILVMLFLGVASWVAQSPTEEHSDPDLAQDVETVERDKTSDERVEERPDPPDTPDAEEDAAEPAMPFDEQPDRLAGIAVPDEQMGLDLGEVKNLEALYSELEESFMEGDVEVWQDLRALALNCRTAVTSLAPLEEQAAAVDDPEERAFLHEVLDDLQGLEKPCRNSRLGDPSFASQEEARWLWKAGQAGDRKASRQLLFSPAGAEERFRQYSGEDGEAYRETRRAMADNLRDDCDAEALDSMGVHFNRDSEVTKGLETGRFEDREEEVARQMEAFAHRYAAGQLKDRAQPAREARDAEVRLTPGQEEAAKDEARDMIADCS